MFTKHQGSVLRVFPGTRIHEIEKFLFRERQGEFYIKSDIVAYSHFIVMKLPVGRSLELLIKFDVISALSFKKRLPPRSPPGNYSLRPTTLTE